MNQNNSSDQRMSDILLDKYFSHTRRISGDKNFLPREGYILNLLSLSIDHTKRQQW